MGLCNHILEKLMNNIGIDINKQEKYNKNKTDKIHFRIISVCCRTHKYFLKYIHLK